MNIKNKRFTLSLMILLTSYQALSAANHISSDDEAGPENDYMSLMSLIKSQGQKSGYEPSIAPTMVTNTREVLDEMTVTLFENLAIERQKENPDFERIHGLEDNIVKATKGKRKGIKKNPQNSLDINAYLRVFNQEKDNAKESLDATEYLLQSYNKELSTFPVLNRKKQKQPRQQALEKAKEELIKHQRTLKQRQGVTQATLRQNEAAQVKRLEAERMQMAQDALRKEKEEEKRQQRETEQNLIEEQENRKRAILTAQKKCIAEVTRFNEECKEEKEKSRKKCAEIEERLINDASTSYLLQKRNEFINNNNSPIYFFKLDEEETRALNFFIERLKEFTKSIDKQDKIKIATAFRDENNPPISVTWCPACLKKHEKPVSVHTYTVKTKESTILYLKKYIDNEKSENIGTRCTMLCLIYPGWKHISQ